MNRQHRSLLIVLGIIGASLQTVVGRPPDELALFGPTVSYDLPHEKAAQEYTRVRLAGTVPMPGPLDLDAEAIHRAVMETVPLFEADLRWHAPRIDDVDDVPAHPEPAHPVPAHPVPAHPEPVRPEPAHAEPARQDEASAEIWHESVAIRGPLHVVGDGVDLPLSQPAEVHLPMTDWFVDEPAAVDPTPAHGEAVLRTTAKALHVVSRSLVAVSTALEQLADALGSQDPPHRDEVMAAMEVHAEGILRSQ